MTQWHRHSSVERHSAAVPKSSDEDSVDDERRPITFQIREKPAEASKSKVAGQQVTEEPTADAQTHFVDHQQSYGATATLLRPDGPPNLRSCKGQKHIHSAFQVNRVVKFTTYKQRLTRQCEEMIYCNYAGKSEIMSSGGAIW